MKMLQKFLDFIGIARVVVSKKEKGRWKNLNQEVNNDGDIAFLGFQEPGEYRLEIWVPTEKEFGAGVVDVEVLNKHFYTPKSQIGNTKGDIRRTRGEFNFADPDLRHWGKEACWVFSQPFEVREKYPTETANERNLYFLLYGVGGIQVFCMSIFDDRMQDKGLYLQVDQIWSGKVGLRQGKFSCPTLERKRGGSPALFQVVCEHFEGKAESFPELKDTPEDFEKGEEVLNLSGLKYGLEDVPGIGGTLVYEVFVNMVSPARAMSFGRDKNGRHIYLNWGNVKSYPGSNIRKIPLGSIVRCRVKTESHDAPHGKKVPLFRGHDIEILPPEATKVRMEELSTTSPDWVEWKDWWHNTSDVDTHAVLATRSRQKAPTEQKKPRRLKQYRALDPKQLQKLGEVFDQAVLAGG